MNFNEKLRIWVEKTFGSLTNGARAMEMHLPDLSRYCSGKVKPTIDFLSKVAKFGGDVNWMLLNDHGPPGVEEPKVDYKNKKLEEENNRLKTENDDLRSRISRIFVIAQALEKHDLLKNGGGDNPSK